MKISKHDRLNIHMTISSMLNDNQDFIFDGMA